MICIATYDAFTDVDIAITDYNVRKMVNARIYAVPLFLLASADRDVFEEPFVEVILIDVEPKNITRVLSFGVIYVDTFQFLERIDRNNKFELVLANPWLAFQWSVLIDLKDLPDTSEAISKSVEAYNEYLLYWSVQC